jgi:hypothetical protein
MRGIHDVVDRLRAEYLEMPGLHLTPNEIERLCRIERTICQAVLDSLVRDRFLTATSDGTYRRATDGVDRPAAKASNEREAPDAARTP